MLPPCTRQCCEQCIDVVQGHQTLGLHCAEFVVNLNLFVYALSALAFASFVTFLAAGKPKGPQPATWGHIQTLADLIDNWEIDEKGQFYWGGNGETEPGVRHTGMSAKKEELGELICWVLRIMSARQEITGENEDS